MVPALAEKCTKYLRDNLTASNVFSILLHAQKFEDKDLEDRCWEVIEKQTEEAVTSDEFVTVERSLVESVVKREVLNVKEVDLFKAVDRWATKKCERQGIPRYGKTKRLILGEEIVKAIRFPLMTEDEFWRTVGWFHSGENILSKDEHDNMRRYYDDELTSPLQFSSDERVDFHRCFRFNKVCPSYGTKWSYNGHKTDHLIFSVDRAIELIGVEHFGNFYGHYSVTIDVMDKTNGGCICSTSGSYSSNLCSGTTRNRHYGFDVLFDQPVHLTPNTFYEIASRINGNSSWYGEKGNRSVWHAGVRFTFADRRKFSGYSNNGTTAFEGQFPALLFTTA